MRAHGPVESATAGAGGAKRGVLEQAAADVEEIVAGLERAQMVVSRERMPIAGVAGDLGDPEFEQACRSAFGQMFAADGNLWEALETAVQVVADRRDRCQRAIDWCETLTAECRRLDALYPEVMRHVGAARRVIAEAPVGERTRALAKQTFEALPPMDAPTGGGLPPWSDVAPLAAAFTERKRVLEKSRAELGSTQANLTKVVEFKHPVRHRIMHVQGLIADPRVSEAAWRAIRPHVDRVLAYVSESRPSDFWADLRRLADVLRAEAAA